MASGWSTTRLDVLRRVMSGYVERGQVPGIVVHLHRRGHVESEVFGTRELGGATSMAHDTIFRISSLTKPITAAATMLLAEECRLALDDPVATWLPELAGVRVLRDPAGPVDDTVTLNRPITVRDLLTYTYGFGLDLGLAAGGAPIVRAESDLHLGVLGPPDPSVAHQPDEWIRRLGTLPLMYQPGERWLYNTSAAVLSVLVARASGQPFEQFLAERLFGPLGMIDTSFSVPPADLGRFTPQYAIDEASGATVVDDPVDGGWSTPPAFPNGASGLVSTATDYAAFGEMMLRTGAHGHGRILARPTVEVMTTDHLTPAQRSSGAPILDAGRGWGLGLAVVRDRTAIAAVPGRFGWDGGLGSSWYADPVNELSAVLMTPHRLDTPVHWNLLNDFWTCVYQALDD